LLNAPKEMVWLAALTVKLWVTDAAALKYALPDCVAAIEQVPAPTRVTADPEIVHTAGVVDRKMTVRPELAVAEIVSGALPKVTALSAPNVIVWLAGFTIKLWLTDAAAL
jgi:hypothetical protein